MRNSDRDSAGSRAVTLAEEVERWRAERATPWGTLRFELLRLRLLAWLERIPARVLDVGCGLGELAHEFAGLGTTVVAVDRSEAMISTARREHQDAFDIEYAVADVDEGLDAFGLFDLVVCHNVIGYSRSPRASVDALASAVGPRGSLSLAFSTPTGEALRQAVFFHDLPSALAFASGEQTARPAPCGQTQPQRRSDVEDWLTAAGLHVRQRAGVPVVGQLLPNELKCGENYRPLRDLEMLLGSAPELLDVGTNAHLFATR
jgi:2-polyprenyl-3-methyl-5-hydroxy-6-metoxy-1,4-benzoquinol methylase